MYVIRGQENAGKTNACWQILNKLKENIECVNYWELRTKDEVRLDEDRQCYVQKIGEKEITCDFVIIVTLKVTHTKVAIISAGDVDYTLRDDIFFMLKREVKHIVCCSRTINRESSTFRMLHYYFEKHIKYSEEIHFSTDVMVKKEWEEKASNEIYQQIKIL